MTQLKDVIHLYLGCEVEYEGILNGSDLKAEKEANKDDFFYVPKVQEVKGVKRGILRSIEVRQDGSLSRIKVGRRGLKSFWFEPNVKPILRPLSDMTEEEWLHVFSLARGIIIEDDSIYRIEKHSTNEVCIRIALAQFLLSYQYHNNADVRVPNGVSFRLKYFYTSNSLEVTEAGINEVKYEFTPMTDEWDSFCFNQSEIFVYLLSRHFDLFNLLETNQAIKKQ